MNLVFQQSNAIFLRQQVFGDAVHAQYVPIFVEDDGAQRQLRHRAIVQRAFGFDAGKARMNRDRALQVRYQPLQEFAIGIDERVIIGSAKMNWPSHDP